MKWRWYLTISAVRQWMQLTGRGGPLEDDNPAFLAAQDELGELSLTAARTAATTRSGAAIYRGWVRHDGRRRRVELTVTPAGRDEGALPQLVRVNWK